MFNVMKIIKVIIFTLSILLFISTLGYSYAKKLDINIYESNDNIRLILTSKNVLSLNAFLLNKPSRLVIDVKNIDNFSKNTFNFKHLEKIRASKENNTSRLVFDLKKKVIKLSKTYIIKQNGTHISVINLKINLKRSSNNINNKKIIIIDAGHGGADPGAIRRNIKEKDLTLMAAKILKKKLEKKSFKVFLTRTSDYYVRLKNRVKYARSKSPDLFISIHADSTQNKNTSGTSIYSLSEKASDKLAQALADRENKSDLIAGLDLGELDKAVSDILIDLSRRETKNSSIEFAELFVDKLKKNKINLLRRPHRQAGFAVLKAPDVPSVLIEMGFLSNNNDLKKLKDIKFQEKLMDTIALVIEEYFESKN